METKSVSTEYPKQFYKGKYDANAINAEMPVAHNAQEEADLRDAWYVDGVEFFSPKPSAPVKTIIAPAKPAPSV